MKDNFENLEIEKLRIEGELKMIISERDKYKQGSEQQKTVIEDLVIQIEIKSKEKNGIAEENELLTIKIKELQNDNTLLLKKVHDLQTQQVDKMNEMNQLYDQIKSMQIQGVISKNDEEDTAPKGINL